ncbi:methyltransferase regulatory domain-containing protein [Chondromyces apiculatus]|uniref:Methyltransferase domain-containing protein n=1 Tax=Chondromyces apiculatus DSM 436 TaxID=1192034 RepID=A0A017T204_9BACT|nr:class I SAM-dependent methyltransferase [Chondromyces apiculatus]EYF02885.1 Hypothetical protein CAP_6465 [Chondromyces apiculatus DSM 436]
MATLFGLSPAPPDRCRVLELGCGLGTNLLAMAVALPGSIFVGIDASARQIASGRAGVEALGLRNVALHAMDIRDVDARFGPFDYVVCHGVYSWVPPDVQAAILTLCRALLAPMGVAYLSYNTLPGWHLRGALRDLMLREIPAQGTPEARLAAAREVLGLLGHAPSLDGARAWLHEELRLLARMSDAYLFHEHLAAENRAVYFRDFARAAAQAGLAYLGDAHLWTMMPDRFGEAAAQAIAQRSRGLVDTEQHLDYLDLRFFRRTLLCHREAPLDRALSWRRLSGLWLRAALTEERTAEQGDTDNGTRGEASFSIGRGLSLSTTSAPLKAALSALAERYPAGMHFEALCARALAESGDARNAEAQDRLGRNLLGLVTRGEIAVDAWARPCTPAPGPRPATTALARLEAARGRDGCTTLLMERVAVDAFDRALLTRMDGAHTWEDLVAGALAEIAAGRLSVEVEGVPRDAPEVLREVTEQKLARLARAGLVVQG